MNFMTGDNEVVIHRCCRNLNTKPYSVLAEKRKSAEKHGTLAGSLVSPKKLRLKGSFQFQDTCFFWCEDVHKAQRKDPHTVCTVSSSDFKQKIESNVLLIRDTWGRNVIGRISSEDSVLAVYHKSCWAKFSRIGSTEKRSPKAPTAAVPSQDASDAMNVIYQYMEDRDDCQFSLRE